jgi:ABC-2 type transport system permease protein
LTALLVIWFALTIAAPPFAAAIVATQHPPPTAAEFVREEAEARAALPAWSERVSSVESRFLDGTLPVGPGVPSNPEVIALIELELDEGAMYDRLFQHMNARFTAFRRTFAVASVLSPRLALQDISTALANTDATFHEAFVDATSAYRREFVQTLNAELAHYAEMDTFDYTGGRELWERVPPFAFDAPNLRQSMAGTLPSLVALAAWLTAALVALAQASRSLRVD